MKRTIIPISMLLCGLAGIVAAQDTIPAGTRIAVRTNDRIRMDNADGQVFSATVANDVADRDGRIIARAGSNAELIIRRLDRNEMAIDLDSITVGGHRYAVAATEDLKREKNGVGANERTGKYVGGTAVLGTLLGAIAGGGRGAAIGAVAGAGAGAGAETLTRGRSINIPAETVLNFELTQTLPINDRDAGVERNGRHYHDYPRDNPR
jgi:hypothetical protein